MNTEEQYIHAFNNGYILKQYEPEFSTILIQTLNPANNYLEGFFSGQEQSELEVNKSSLFELQKLRNKSQNKKRGLEL
jgi:hypothetical protein